MTEMHHFKCWLFLSCDSKLNVFEIWSLVRQNMSFVYVTLVIWEINLQICGYLQSPPIPESKLGKKKQSQSCNLRPFPIQVAENGIASQT